MGPLSAEVEIDVPRERAFEAIADLALRPSFTDHFLTDFHLTRIDSAGVGAGARFRIDLAPRRVWMDTTIVGQEPPHKVIERGTGGRTNRIATHTVWELVEGTGTLTRVRVAHWTEPSNPLDRRLEVLSGAAGRQERAWREALRRLRDLLEADGAAAERLTVAGGNPHMTGIP
ncbi:MAG TPA: SRPBCC family protein [Solirubrobacterales bacterium]|nr:SRPBCC family protein [Solirubrobacterales bacterium]